MRKGLPHRAAPAAAACAIALAAAVFGGAAPAQATGGYYTSTLWNDGTLARGSLGVIHLWDGHYGSSGTAKYDAVLEPDALTTKGRYGWDETAGFYLGTGYCAQVWLDTGTDGWESYTRWGSDVGAGQHRVPDGTAGNPRKWRVVPYHC